MKQIVGLRFENVKLRLDGLVEMRNASAEAEIYNSIINWILKIMIGFDSMESYSH